MCSGPSEDGGDVKVVVRVVKEAGADAKPFQGGYRDKRTGVEYHNADVQTAVDETRSQVSAIRAEELLCA